MTITTSSFPALSKSMKLPPHEAYCALIRPIPDAMIRSSKTPSGDPRYREPYPIEVTRMSGMPSPLTSPMAAPIDAAASPSWLNATPSSTAASRKCPFPSLRSRVFGEASFVT